MNKKEYQEFMKKYDKYKNNNLPTPFFDRERLTLEYVYNDNNKIEVTSNLSYALESIARTGLYYSFSINNQHCHAHSFEEVLRSLYDYPETFNITKEDEEFYSQQELDYLKHIKNYLLFIELKDIKDNKRPSSRYKNKKQKKYSNATIHKFDNKLIKEILNNKINYNITNYYPEFKERKFEPKELQALIVDDNDNFIMLVEYTHNEIKQYKDIKKMYKIKNLKNNDKVILTYFKVLEVF